MKDDSTIVPVPNPKRIGNIRNRVESGVKKPVPEDDTVRMGVDLEDNPNLTKKRKSNPKHVQKAKDIEKDTVPAKKVKDDRVNPVNT